MSGRASSFALHKLVRTRCLADPLNIIISSSSITKQNLVVLCDTVKARAGR